MQEQDRLYICALLSEGLKLYDLAVQDGELGMHESDDDGDGEQAGTEEVNLKDQLKTSSSPRRTGLEV